MVNYKITNTFKAVVEDVEITNERIFNYLIDFLESNEHTVDFEASKNLVENFIKAAEIFEEKNLLEYFNKSINTLLAERSTYFVDADFVETDGIKEIAKELNIEV